MAAKVRFWLHESSRLIAKASFSVMILKSAFLNSLFTTRPCFTRKATPPLRPVERSFRIVSIITLNFEIDLFGKERFIKSNDVNCVFFKV